MWKTHFIIQIKMLITLTFSFLSHRKMLLGTIIAFDIFNQIFLTIINYVPFRVYFNLHL